MKLPGVSQLFLDLAADIDCSQWDDWEMRALTRLELRLLGNQIGLVRGYSVAKDELIVRLLGIRQIWLKVRKTGDVHRAVESWKAHEMKGMCREIGYPRSRRKAQLAELLVYWCHSVSWQWAKEAGVRWPAPWIIAPRHLGTIYRLKRQSGCKAVAARLQRASNAPINSQTFVISA